MSSYFGFGDVDGIAVYEVWGDEWDVFPKPLVPLIEAVGREFGVSYGESPAACSRECLTLAEVAWGYGGWDRETGRLDRGIVVEHVVYDNTPLSREQARWVAKWYDELWAYAVQRGWYGSNVIFRVMDEEAYDVMCREFAEDGIDDPADVLIVCEDEALDGYLVVGEW